jgi:hypothetical protein
VLKLLFTGTHRASSLPYSLFINRFKFHSTPWNVVLDEASSYRRNLRIITVVVVRSCPLDVSKQLKLLETGGRPECTIVPDSLTSATILNVLILTSVILLRYHYLYVLAVLWLRRLVTGLSPRRPWFAPRSVHVGFWCTVLRWDRFLPEFFGFTPISNIPPWPTIFIHILYSLGDEQRNPLVAAVKRHSVTRSTWQQQQRRHVLRTPSFLTIRQNCSLRPASQHVWDVCGLNVSWSLVSPCCGIPTGEMFNPWSRSLSNVNVI